MAINPLNAALAAVQLGAGIAGLRGRMRDRSAQDRIRRLLAQAQAQNVDSAQAIAGSGVGISPALAQRSALDAVTQANAEATQAAMNQEAAMAERDRARTDRLTGGMLGALGSFGAQLLAGQDAEDENSVDAKNAMAAMSRQIAAKRDARPEQGQIDALDALAKELEYAPADAAPSPIMAVPTARTPTPELNQLERDLAAEAAQGAIVSPIRAYRPATGESPAAAPSGPAEAQTTPSAPAETAIATPGLDALSRRLDRGRRLGTMAITPQRPRVTPPTPPPPAPRPTATPASVGMSSPTGQAVAVPAMPNRSMPMSSRPPTAAEALMSTPRPSPNMSMPAMSMPLSSQMPPGQVVTPRPPMTMQRMSPPPSARTAPVLMSVPRPPTAAEALMSIPQTDLPPYLLRRRRPMPFLGPTFDYVRRSR